MGAINQFQIVKKTYYSWLIMNYAKVAANYNIPGHEW